MTENEAPVQSIVVMSDGRWIQIGDISMLGLELAIKNLTAHYNEQKRNVILQTPEVQPANEGVTE